MFEKIVKASDLHINTYVTDEFKFFSFGHVKKYLIFSKNKRLTFWGRNCWNSFFDQNSTGDIFVDWLENTRGAK